MGLASKGLDLRYMSSGSTAGRASRKYLICMLSKLFLVRLFVFSCKWSSVVIAASSDMICSRMDSLISIVEQGFNYLGKGVFA